MAFPIPPNLTTGTANPIVRPSFDRSGEAAEQAGGEGFFGAINGALGDMQQTQAAVEDAALRAATGDLTSISDFMIAATEAQIATEITVAVRDRAITAFNDIMRMQI